MTAARQQIHEGLLALLGVIVTASIFTLGFLSHRSHAALRDAQQHLETGGGAKSRRMAHAHRLLSATRSWFVLLVNLALFAGLLLVIFGFADTAGIGQEGKTTLWGFALVEAAVLVLALGDRYVVGRELEAAMDAAPVDDEERMAPVACRERSARMWNRITARLQLRGSRCPPGPPTTDG